MSARGSIWGVVVMLGALSSPARAEEAASPQPLSVEETKVELARLQDLWNVRWKEFQNCDIRYRLYHLVPVNPPLTTEQFEQKLDEYGLRTSPERVNEFMAALCPGFTPKKDTRRIVRDGLLARYEVGDDIKVHDAENQLEYTKGDNTITVTNTFRNESPIPQLDVLWKIPSGVFLMPDEVILTRSPSEIAIKYKSTVSFKGQALPTENIRKYDTVTGLPLYEYCGLTGPNDASSQSRPLEAFYQLQLERNFDGAVFPRCRVAVTFNRDRPGFIDYLTLSDILVARINCPISPDTFAMPKKRGVRVIDERDPMLIEDLADVESDDIRLLINPPVIITSEPVRIPWQRRAFFIINGLILIALGIWLWRRVSLK